MATGITQDDFTPDAPFRREENLPGCLLCQQQAWCGAKTRAGGQREKFKEGYRERAWAGEAGTDGKSIEMKRTEGQKQSNKTI